MATEIGVTRKTLDNWAEAHPEFLHALSRALELSQRWWEDKGQDGIDAEKFNGGVWSRNMAARFPADWRERSESEQTIKGKVSVDDESSAMFRKLFPRVAAEGGDGEA